MTAPAVEARPRLTEYELPTGAGEAPADQQPLRRPLTLLVCGSRDWPEDWMWWVDARMIAIASEQPHRVHVITGGARGVDDRADACAARSSASFTREVFRADWKRYGQRAGFIRNLAMLDQRPDLVLAFQFNGSRGTQHTIENARVRAIPVEVHTELPRPDLAAIDSTP